MTLSDALPVQFWPASQETFNEKDPQGVFRKCFCHPWECEDEIKIQFLDTTGKTYNLLVLDSDENVLTELKFVEGNTGVYSKSIIPIDEGICDEDIQLIILEIADLSLSTEVMSNPSFVASLLPWTTSGAGTNWTWDAGEFASVGSTVASRKLEQNVGDHPAGWYYITINMQTGAAGNPTILVEAFDNAVLTEVILTKTYLSIIIPSNTQTYAVYINSVFDTIKFSVTNSSATIFHLYNFSLKPINGEPIDFATAKSDCLNIKPSQDETILITYSDNKNFAGLDYSSVTPDPEYYIRIPAVFYHERFPEESEVIELSNSRSIQLNAQVKAQRLMEIKPMPYFMHRKMKLILKHQFVTIDDQDWVQSELYELIESNRRSVLKKATVWLDEKDYILRNVL